MPNYKDIILKFVEGETDGVSSGQGNLRIRGQVLYHYTTPILERMDKKYILNNTRYSIVTGKLQKQIKESIPEEELIIVTKVAEGYKGSLQDYLNTEKSK